jgi:hypothetical protein
VVTFSLIGIIPVLWGTREEKREAGDRERAVPWGLVEDVGVGEGEAVIQ